MCGGGSVGRAYHFILSEWEREGKMKTVKSREGSGEDGGK